MSRNNKGTDLGPIVGQILGKDIRANQLMRKGYDWDEGAGSPSDGQDTNALQGPVRKKTANATSLIIYWSRSGSTELLASKILKQIPEADVFQIQLKHPYPANYQETLDRANRERLTSNPPEVVPDLVDLSQYKDIYIGFQTWAMTLSQPLQGFFKKYGQEFVNKNIFPFETEGSYGAGNSINVMKRLIETAGGKNNTFSAPLVIDGNMVDESSSAIKTWVKQTSK